MNSLGLPDDSFRYALDVHAIVAITDRRGIILEVNQKFCDISGYNREELIGKTHRLINSQRHGKEFFANMWNTILAGTPWTGEVCNRRKDGSFYWLDATIVPVLGEDGAPTHFIAVRRDITQRKLAAMLDRNILDNAGTSVIATDTNGLITLFNHGAEQLLGYKAEDVIGKCTPEAFHDLSEVVVRAAELSQELGHKVRPDFETFIAKALSTHLPDVHDWTYIAKDRSRHTVSLSVTLLTDSLGHIEGYLGIASDVTDLRQSVGQKQEFANRLKKIASQVPGMVYQFRIRPDGHSCFPYASEGIHPLFGLSPEDVLDSAEPLLKMVHPEDQEALALSTERSRTQLTQWNHEFRIQPPSQTEKWLHGSAVPEQLADGTVQWHGLLSDISDRKIADEKLIQASLHDPLTGLHNRLFAEMEIKRLSEGRRFPISVLMIDLDGLKVMNDQFGHEAGDKLIQSAGALLRSCFRPEDLVARMGGDEFLVMLPLTPEPECEIALRRLRESVDALPPLKEGYRLCLSAGGAVAQKQSELHQAMVDADQAMYADKVRRKAGRG
jgi:diguanylate cyclase (GGDEF)-like protein/PAS domain S-box-containing protein